MPTILDIDDPRAFEWRKGLDGRPVKVLRDDVHGVRVRMTARDSVAGEIAASQQRVVDAAGHAGFGLQRPGARRLADDHAYDAAREAYLERVASGESAWRDGPGPVATELAPDTASAPAWHDSISFADAEKLKAAAYEARVRGGEAAWKTLGEVPA